MKTAVILRIWLVWVSLALGASPVWGHGTHQVSAQAAVQSRFRAQVRTSVATFAFPWGEGSAVSQWATLATRFSKTGRLEATISAHTLRLRGRPRVLGVGDLELRAVWAAQTDEVSLWATAGIHTPTASVSRRLGAGHFSLEAAAGLEARLVRNLWFQVNVAQVVSFLSTSEAHPAEYVNVHHSDQLVLGIGLRYIIYRVAMTVRAETPFLSGHSHAGQNVSHPRLTRPFSADAQWRAVRTEHFAFNGGIRYTRFAEPGAFMADVFVTVAWRSESETNPPSSP